jgi:hypothetical protein
MRFNTPSSAAWSMSPISAVPAATGSIFQPSNASRGVGQVATHEIPATRAQHRMPFQTMGLAGGRPLRGPAGWRISTPALTTLCLPDRASPTCCLSSDALRVADLATDEGWGEFGARAAAEGARTLLTCLLPLPRRRGAVLSLYASRTDAFELAAELVVPVFAARAARLAGASQGVQQSW